MTTEQSVQTVESSTTLDSDKSYLPPFYRWLNDEDNAYFKPRSFERWKNGLVYRMLGIKTVKRYIPTGGDYVARKYNFSPFRNKGSSREKLECYNLMTRYFETIHAVGFSLFCVKIASDFAEGNTRAAVGSAIYNTIANVYPIMLQRYNRARINFGRKKKNSL